jgi:hypothetical protein
MGAARASPRTLPAADGPPSGGHQQQQPSIRPASSPRARSNGDYARTHNLDKEAFARMYDMLLEKGLTPNVALHAARARAVNLQQRRRLLAPPTQDTAQAVSTQAGAQPQRASATLLGLSPYVLPARSLAVNPLANRLPATSKPRQGSRNDRLAPIGYQTVGPIAAGAFSQIVRAKSIATGEEFAVKSFLTRSKGGRAPDKMDWVRRELECLQRLQPQPHDHVANLIATHEDQQELHLVLKYCAGGSLQRFLQTQGHRKGVEESAAAPLLAQVGSALAHLHSAGVAHRDLKPSNVVFNSNTRDKVSLVDFGFATIFRAKGSTACRRLKTYCGSPAYMAPELVRGNTYHGPHVDVWSFGALMYELLHNQAAFRAESMAQLNARILKGSHETFGTNVSPRMRKLITRLLAVDASERPSAATIVMKIHEHLGLESYE